MNCPIVVVIWIFGGIQFLLDLIGRKRHLPSFGKDPMGVTIVGLSKKNRVEGDKF